MSQEGPQKSHQETAPTLDQLKEKAVSFLISTKYADNKLPSGFPTPREYALRDFEQAIQGATKAYDNLKNRLEEDQKLYKDMPEVLKAATEHQLKLSRTSIMVSFTAHNIPEDIAGQIIDNYFLKKE